jgi:hypothetical protein
VFFESLFPCQGDDFLLHGEDLPDNGNEQQRKLRQDVRDGVKTIIRDERRLDPHQFARVRWATACLSLWLVPFSVLAGRCNDCLSNRA